MFLKGLFQANLWQCYIKLYVLYEGYLKIMHYLDFSHRIFTKSIWWSWFWPAVDVELWEDDHMDGHSVHLLISSNVGNISETKFWDWTKGNWARAWGFRNMLTEVLLLGSVTVRPPSSADSGKCSKIWLITSVARTESGQYWRCFLLLNQFQRWVNLLISTV